MARIVVLGGGFAGVECVKQLQRGLSSNSSTEIVMISEDNFLLFTPMLPQVASGTIQTRNIVMPIRTILKKARFYEGRVKNIDPVARRVSVWGTPEKRGVTLDYDYLVVALGSETNFFGMSDLEANSFQMKTLNDAVSVRNRVIDMLEQADNETDAEVKRSLLTFVVVGGGFAGIETAGELNDLLADALKHYPGVRSGEVKVLVLEALPAILPGFSEKLASFAQSRMVREGIRIMLRTAVTGFDGNEVATKDLETGETGRLYTKTLIWTAGVTPVNTIKRSIFKTERGKMVVDEYLEAEGYPGVFAAGDCALSVDPATGRPYAPTAQLAEAQAKSVAANLNAAINGREMKKFSYSPRGQMAIIGKRAGIASVFGLNIQGIIAWMLWRNIYLSKVPTFSKRVRVALDWIEDTIFDRDIARLKFMGKSRLKEYGTLNQVDDFW